MPRMAFFADDELANRLRALATEQGISISQLVVEVLSNATNVESTLAAPDSLPSIMAKVLEAVATYVDACKKDSSIKKMFALRDIVPGFQQDYPMFIEKDGKKVRNAAAGRIGRQFFYLVNKGLVPNIKSTGLFDRSRTLLYEVELNE